MLSGLPNGVSTLYETSARSCSVCALAKDHNGAALEGCNGNFQSAPRRLVNRLLLPFNADLRPQLNRQGHVAGARCWHAIATCLSMSSFIPSVLLFGISESMIHVCGALCHAALRWAGEPAGEPAPSTP